MSTIQVFIPKQSSLTVGVVNIRVKQSCYDSSDWVVHRVSVEDAQQIAEDLANAITAANNDIRLVHWVFPMFDDIWDGAAQCGAECNTEDTSVGPAITCPQCLQLFVSAQQRHQPDHPSGGFARD